MNCLLLGSLLQWFLGWCWGMNVVDITQLTGHAVPSGEWWRLLSYPISYQNTWLLLFESLCLWLFGCAVEERLGSGRFTLLFLGGVLAGGLGIHGAELMGQPVTWGGATPAIAAVLLAYARLFPGETLPLFVGLAIVPARACYLAVGLALGPAFFFPQMLPALLLSALWARALPAQPLEEPEVDLLDRLRRLEYAGLTAEERQRFDQQGRNLRQEP